jgi:hypothetical protein
MFIKTCGGSISRRIEDCSLLGVIMSLLGKLAEARAALEAHNEDPWHTKVEAAMRGQNAISTNALLDLLGAPATTAAARRVAVIMRNLQFVAIKSRKLMPGGFRGTVARGWARAVRGPSPLLVPQERPRQGRKVNS